MRAMRTAPLSSTATAPAVEEALATAANEARGLAMDSIAAAESGCVVAHLCVAHRTLQLRHGLPHRRHVVGEQVHL